MSDPRLEFKLPETRTSTALATAFQAIRSEDILVLLLGLLKFDKKKTNRFFKRLIFLQPHEYEILLNFAEKILKVKLQKQDNHLAKQRMLMVIYHKAWSCIPQNQNVRPIFFCLTQGSKSQIIFLNENCAEKLIDEFKRSLNQEPRQGLPNPDIISDGLTHFIDYSFDGEFHTNLEYTIAAANVGCFDALFHLGLAHQNGLLGAEKNPDKAKKIFSYLASQGDPDALYQFAQLLLPEDQGKWQLIRLAAHYGNSKARAELSQFFLQPTVPTFFHGWFTSKQQLPPALIYHAALELQDEVKESGDPTKLDRLKICSDLMRTHPELAESLAYDLNDSPDRILSFLEADEIKSISETQEYILSSTDKLLLPPLLRLIADYTFYNPKNDGPEPSIERTMMLRLIAGNVPNQPEKKESSNKRREMFFPAPSKPRFIIEDQENQSEKHCTVM